MTPITYRFKRSRRGTILSAAVFFMLCLTQLLVVFSLVSSMEGNWPYLPEEDLPTVVSGLLIGFACLLGVAMALKPGGTGREFLALDDEGLTYGNLFGRNRWAWRDLSAFALRRPSEKVAYVTFGLPEKPGWTVNRCYSELTAVGEKAMIEDIYDRPLDEIAAKLNEYRDRALGAQEAR